MKTRRLSLFCSLLLLGIQCKCIGSSKEVFVNEIKKSKHQNELVCVLALSGCGCVSDYENIHQWKRLYKALRKKGGITFRALKLKGGSDLLITAYGFEFSLYETEVEILSKSITIAKFGGQVFFVREGPISMDDYLFIRKIFQL